MVGTNASRNENYKFYKSAVQDISRGRGYFATKIGALYARFVEKGPTLNTQVKMD